MTQSNQAGVKRSRLARGRLGASGSASAAGLTAATKLVPGPHAFATHMSAITDAAAVPSRSILGAAPAATGDDEPSAVPSAAPSAVPSAVALAVPFEVPLAVPPPAAPLPAGEGWPACRLACLSACRASLALEIEEALEAGAAAAEAEEVAAAELGAGVARGGGGDAFGGDVALAAALGASRCKYASREADAPPVVPRASAAPTPSTFNSASACDCNVPWHGRIWGASGGKAVSRVASSERVAFTGRATASH